MLYTCGTFVVSIAVIAFGLRTGQAFDVRKLRNDNRLRHFGLLPDFDDEPEPGPPGGRHLNDSDNDDDDDDDGDDDDDAPYLSRIPHDRLPANRHRSGRQPPPRSLPDAADDGDDEMFPIRKRYYVPAVSCDKSSLNAGPGSAGPASTHHPQSKLRRAPRIIRRRSIPSDAVDARQRPPPASRLESKLFRPEPPSVGEHDEHRRQMGGEHIAANRRQDDDDDGDGEHTKVLGASVDDLLEDRHGNGEVDHDENGRQGYGGDNDDDEEKEYMTRFTVNDIDADRESDVGRDKSIDSVKDPKHSRPRNAFIGELFDLQRKLRYEGLPMSADPRRDQDREHRKPPGLSPPPPMPPMDSQH